ncbi:MAG: hypothetical protein LKG27_03225 [Clostridiaceae bacterium]|nr:hypothetical protein [Clostridiaceae bacterium]
MLVGRTQYFITPKIKDYGEVFPNRTPLSPEIKNQQFNKDINERPFKSNSSNLSFKGLSFWYKTPVTYDTDKFLEFTQKHLGSMGKELFDSVKKEAKHSKNFVTFSEDGKITFKQKAWGQLLIDGVKYPFTVLPLDIVNGAVSFMRKIKPLQKWADKKYNSDFLRNVRQRSKMDAKISSLKGLFEFEKELSGKSEQEVAARVYERSLRMFDPKTGNYDTKHERALNRLVSGLPPAIFLANDAYNLSRMMDDDPNAAKKEQKTRFKQETTRIVMSGYLTLITMGALSKIMNKSQIGIMGLTAGTVLATEMYSRLSNGKHITKLTPEQARRENEKNHSEEAKIKPVKTFTAGPTKVETEKEKQKKPLLSIDTLLKASLAIIAAGFSVKGLRKIKSIDKLFKSVEKPANDFYKKLTENPNYSVSSEKFDKIIDVLKENGFEELATKYKDIANNIEKNADGSLKLGTKDKKIKPLVNFIRAPFRFAWKTVTLPYWVLDKYAIPAFVKAFSNKAQIIEKAKTPKQIKAINEKGLMKIVDYIGKEALKKDMDPKKFQDFVKDNILKAFNTDTLSSISNSDLSNLAKTAATAATIWFLMTDNYNMVMLKSNGNDVQGAQTKFKERFVQEGSRLFYQTLLIDLFNSTFRSQYNKSLWGMSWITAVDTTLGEILTRKSIGTPVKAHTRKELEDIDTRQNAATGFTKGYYTFMKRLTGKRSVQSYSVEKKEEKAKQAANDVAVAIQQVQEPTPNFQNNMDKFHKLMSK